MCTQQIFCLDYSNLQERRNITKLYMISRGHWSPVYGLWDEGALVFFTRKIIQPKYHWVEIKYLGAIQNQHQ